MASLKLVTAPSLFPVGVEDLKSYARIDSCDEDAVLKLMIESGTRLLEEYTGRKFITQTWDLFLDCFPYGRSRVWWDGQRDGHINVLNGAQGEIEIPCAFIQSVTFLKTIDNDDNEYTFDANEYYVDTSKAYGRIVLRLGSVWPTTTLRTGNGIQIRFVAGYGSTVASVPAPIRQAILETASFIYQNRGAESAGIPNLALQLIEPFRVVKC
jgi:hypothetical protein